MVCCKRPGAYRCDRRGDVDNPARKNGHCETLTHLPLLTFLLKLLPLVPPPHDVHFFLLLFLDTVLAILAPGTLRLQPCRLARDLGVHSADRFEVLLLGRQLAHRDVAAQIVLPHLTLRLGQDSGPPACSCPLGAPYAGGVPGIVLPAAPAACQLRCWLANCRTGASAAPPGAAAARRSRQ
jgi:hypothetical protein